MKSNYKEAIRRENEIIKLKIQAEFGADFNNNSINELDPAIENIWLNNILEFERAALKKETIKIIDKIGNPSFTPTMNITDENISDELDNILSLLRKNKIVVESLDGVTDRELYRFITEELFFEEMNKIEIQNMFTFFIYEEFHPNNEADIKRHSADFMNVFLTKSDDFMDNFFLSNSEEVKDVKIQNLKRRLKLFRDAYDDFKADEFIITSLIFEELNAELKFDFRLGVLLPGSHTFHTISGTGKFKYIFDYGNWVIEDMEMTGVV